MKSISKPTRCGIWIYIVSIVLLWLSWERLELNFHWTVHELKILMTSWPILSCFVKQRSILPLHFHFIVFVASALHFFKARISAWRVAVPSFSSSFHFLIMSRALNDVSLLGVILVSMWCDSNPSPWRNCGKSTGLTSCKISAKSDSVASVLSKKWYKQKFKRSKALLIHHLIGAVDLRQWK